MQLMNSEILNSLSHFKVITHRVECNIRVRNLLKQAPPNRYDRLISKYWAKYSKMNLEETDDYDNMWNRYRIRFKFLSLEHKSKYNDRNTESVIPKNRKKG